jgi:hypothetical protein
MSLPYIFLGIEGVDDPDNNTYIATTLEQLQIKLQGLRGKRSLNIAIDSVRDVTSAEVLKDLDISRLFFKNTKCQTIDLSATKIKYVIVLAHRHLQTVTLNKDEIEGLYLEECPSLENISSFFAPLAKLSHLVLTNVPLLTLAWSDVPLATAVMHFTQLPLARLEASADTSDKMYVLQTLTLDNLLQLGVVSFPSKLPRLREVIIRTCPKLSVNLAFMSHLSAVTSVEIDGVAAIDANAFTTCLGLKTVKIVGPGVSYDLVEALLRLPKMTMLTATGLDSKDKTKLQQHNAHGAQLIMD